MNIETYLILFSIIVVIASVFLVHKVKVWNDKEDEKLRLKLAEIDNEFKIGMEKIDTATAFIKAGYHTPPGEAIIEIGDGYLVSLTPGGENFVTLLPNSIRH